MIRDIDFVFPFSPFAVAADIHCRFSANFKHLKYFKKYKKAHII